MESNRKVAVCHLISGDLWAGAEAQAFIMISALARRSDLRLSALVLNRGKLSARLAEAGVPVSVIEESRSSFRQIVNEAQRLLGAGGIDIIHSHRYKENLLAALIKRRCGVHALVQTVHGVQERLPGWKQAKVRLYGSLNQFVSRKYFSRILPVSRDIHAQLGAKYSAGKLTLLHNAIDVAAVKPGQAAGVIRAQLGLNPEDIVIGSVGRLVPIKGFEVFLRVVAETRKSISGLRFLLIGDGPGRASLEKLALELGVADVVTFAGFRDDIIDVVNALDIFMMTSWHEGVPVALLEAMALSKPVISTAVGGVVEVIESEHSGILVPAGDHAALAQACIRLAQASDLRQRLGQEARRRVEADFSSSAQSQKLAEIYWSLIS